jgi:Methane oxygenase PmoA
MSRSSRTPFGAWACWMVALATSGVALAAEPHHLKVSGDGRTSGETPIVVECPGNFSPGDYSLTAGDGKAASKGNVFKDAGKTYLGVLLGPSTDGPVTFDLPSVPSSSTAGAGVELIEHGRRIEVRVDGKPVTEYIPDDGPKPFFFPMFGPSGSAMTRSFPMKKVEGEKSDHPHQRSLWFTHGSVNKIDFWSEVSGHGRIVETSRPTAVGGLAVGTIRTTDDWLGPDGKKVCEDERVVRIYSTKKDRVLDFDVTLKATEGPVTFGDTKEGMFGVRVATSMDVTAKKGGKIVNAGKIENAAAWGKPSPWVDYTGPVNGKTGGIAILNHPSSFRYPTTWHVRDYGLFAANPFGWHDFGQKTSGEYVLPKGESIRFRYRVILHDGDTASAVLPAAFQGYWAPPKATID